MPCRHRLAVDIAPNPITTDRRAGHHVLLEAAPQALSECLSRACAECASESFGSSECSSIFARRTRRMFLPHDFNLALLMMITSAVCWGSWANTYKGVKNYRFELFYWDYAIGIFFVSLVLAFTLGSTPHDSSSFLNNASGADGSNIISTLIGGAVFNLTSLLLLDGIDMACIVVRFPVV